MYGTQHEEDASFSVDVSQKTKMDPVKVKDVRDYLPKHFGGLSRPAFDKSGTQFIFGTEYQDNENSLSNRIVLGRIDLDSIEQEEEDKWDSLSIMSYPINEHVRDVDWLDSTRIVVALNQKLGIVILGENQTLNEIVLFPDFHTDTIRELKVNPKDQHLVISGGFDGNVFVTDVSRLVDDIQKNEKKSENSVYLCKDVVGSVSWHPNDHNVASCTTDIGVLHVFDIRTDQSKPAFVYDTGKVELYSHAYIDDFTVCLGYGDGIMQIHDIRHGKGITSIKDPHSNVIGDLMFCPTGEDLDPGSKKMASFGIPSMTLWHFPSDLSGIECYSFTLPPPSFMQNTISKEPYSISGTCIPNSNTILTTDSAGYLSLFAT